MSLLLDNALAAPVSTLSSGRSVDDPRLTQLKPRSLAVSRSLRVLVVDDDDEARRTVSLLMARAGYVVRTATDGVEALESLLIERPDIVLLDVNMPRINGLEVCRRIKEDPSTCLTPVVLISALAETTHRIDGLNAGADDILAKPFSSGELLARIRALMRRRRAVDDLEPAETVMLSLAMTIEARDPYTRGHCERLSRYASLLGERLGLEEQDMVTVARGAFLHDVGKVGIPDAILLKQGALTPAEHAIMQQHTVIGDRLCSHLQSLTREREVIRWHHERLDGTGYPDNLRGDEIPLTAQIVGVVDLFDAVTTSRPYKHARTPAMALRCLHEEVERGWKRGDLVETFEAIVSELTLDRNVA